jgi:hypothetical protein
MLLMSQKSEEQKLFHQSQVHGDADHLSGGDISADEIKSWSLVGVDVGRGWAVCTQHSTSRTHSIDFALVSSCRAQTNKRGISTKGVRLYSVRFPMRVAACCELRSL